MSPATPFSECEACACFAVRRAARAVTQYYDRQLRPADLRATQFTLLVLLTRAGELPVSRAADCLGMERTTLTRNLRPLLAKGYIQVQSGEDRRIRMIAITREGRAAATAALPYWRKAQRAIAGRLPPNVLNALATVGRTTA